MWWYFRKWRQDGTWERPDYIGVGPRLHKSTSTRAKVRSSKRPLCASPGKGFHQTTIQDICREAELSPGAVYRYFESKDEIIDVVCDLCRVSNLATIEQARSEGDTFGILDDLLRQGIEEMRQPEAEIGLSLNVQWWGEALRNPDLNNMLRTDLSMSGLKRWLGYFNKAKSAMNSIQTLTPRVQVRCSSRCGSV